MKPSWKKYLLYASLILVVGGLIFFLVETVRAKNTGFETKTLWDWMELLIIPFVLAIGAFYLNRSERAVERQIAENRIKEDRVLAEDRAKLEREIAKDRQQETAFQAYLDRMTELLLKEQLRTSESQEVRNVARTLTLSTVRGLDPIRKGLLLKFLFEAKLIDKGETFNTKPIVDLRKADFSGADLSNTALWGSDLSGIILKEANFQGAELQGTKFFMADLRGADFRGAIINNASFYKADMMKANLQVWDNTGANFTDTLLEGATMPDGTIHD